MAQALAADDCKLDSLTEGQKDCLRLVMLHMSSKEIARTLGISPHTVDQRLRVATRNLGVSTRFEAARMLAIHGEAEAGEAYQPLIYQVPGLGSGFANHHSLSGVDVGGYQAAPLETGLELHARKAGYSPRFEAGSSSQKWLLPPIWGDGASELTSSQRVMIVILIALGSLMAFGTLVSGLDALSRLI